MALRGASTYLLIGLASVLVYSNSLSGDFTFDDNSAIVSNRYVHTNETEWWSIWSVDYWGTPIQSERSHKSFRPLTSLTFRLNYLFTGLEPFPFHLVNVFLHALVSVIFYQFMLNMLNDAWPCFLLALFFAVHPVKSEAVSGIVGRAELLCTFFFLMALFCFFDNSLHSFAVYAVLATFSKEQGLTVPCVCIVLELLKLYFHFRSVPRLGHIGERLVTTAKHGSLLRVILLTAFTAALAAIRFWVMGSLPVFTKFDNPSAFEPTPIRQLNYNYLLPLNVLLMLYPRSLCADWTMNSIPLIRDYRDIRCLAILAFYLVLLGLVIRALVQLHVAPLNGRSRSSAYNQKIALTLGLCLTIIPFIPASNLLFPVGFVLAERVLYTPSIGYCFLLAIGLIRIRDFVHSRWFTVLLYSLTSVVILIFATRTIIRNRDWQNDLTLFTSGLKVNPYNAKLYNNIGHFYERKNQYLEAIKYFKQAARIDAEDIGAELNIARALIQLNRIDQAEALLWQIKPRVRSSAIRNRIVPNYLNLWINLARVISLNDSRLGEAENLYREVISIRRDFLDAFINLGELYIRRQQYDEAIEIYQEALNRAEYKNDLKAADLYYNIAIAKTLQLNSVKETGADKAVVLEEIAKHLVSAIDINANHKEALINLAILVQKPEFLQDNRTHYREYVLNALQAYTKNEEQEVIEFNIAITLLDLGGPSNRLQAIDHLRKAVEIKPSFRSALYNLALLYYDFKDYNSSLLYLRQICDYHSNYTKAFLLMADIYSKLRQMDLAEKTYVKVLEVDGENYEALHNLYQIYKINNRLEQFEKYLPRLANSSRP